MGTTKSSRGQIFVAGHQGMVGSAILNRLRAESDEEILVKTRAELDLSESSEVRRLFQTNQIEQVYLCAAKVGGIQANNTFPAEFIYTNLVIQNNLIHESYRAGVRKLLFLGSSCIYPKMAPQPMDESVLLTGKLEETNEPYAIAKIAGIKMCESYNRQYGTDFRAVMPTNLYGPNDNFHPENSHVVPALIRRFHEAKHNNLEEVLIWGTGKPKRELLHVDDMADACIFLMNLDDVEMDNHDQQLPLHINIGSGEEVSIGELAHAVANVVGYAGKISFDTSKPDGTPRKLLDVSRMTSLGWRSRIGLKEGLVDAYKWYQDNLDTLRA